MAFASVIETVGGMTVIAFLIALLGALGGVWSWLWVLGIGLFGLGIAAIDGWLSGDAKQGAQATASVKTKELMKFGFQAGLEFYSSQPLAEGLRCKITVQGMDDYMHQYVPGGWTFAKLDAIYLLGGGLFSRHESLLFDGRSAVAFEEDPPKHCYSFTYTGTGRHLSMLLRIPKDHKSYHTSEQTAKQLQVTIRTLSPTEEAKVKAIEHEHHRETTQMQQEALRRQALELATLAYVENNLLKPEYQQNYAAKHTTEILKTVSPQWRAEYLALVSNEPLYALVQAEHPHVLEFFFARFEVARIAQRLAVEPPSKPQAPEPKRKFTREEWQEKIERFRQRQLDRMRVGADDHIAKMLERFESVRRLRERAEGAGLDEDEIESLERQLLEDLNQDEDDTSHGYRQL